MPTWLLLGNLGEMPRLSQSPALLVQMRRLSSSGAREAHIPHADIIGLTHSHLEEHWQRLISSAKLIRPAVEGAGSTTSEASTLHDLSDETQGARVKVTNQVSPCRAERSPEAELWVRCHTTDLKFLELFRVSLHTQRLGTPSCTYPYV